jgi:CHAT domain-containing protein/Tfp pilus assembly protein PilF
MSRTASIAIAGLFLSLFFYQPISRSSNYSENAPRSWYGVQQFSAVLEPGARLQRGLGGGETHSYSISLNSGEYIRIVITQQGIDVVVRVYAPDGSPFAEMDSPSGRQGLEPVSILAQTAGVYRLEVGSPNRSAAAGKYEVQAGDKQAGGAAERNRVAAEAQFVEAQRVLRQGPADARRAALNILEQAGATFQSVGDAERATITFNYVGFLFMSLGEMRKALPYCERALPLARQIADRRMEAIILNNLGGIHDALGDGVKAKDHWLLALEIRRELGERGLEAQTLANLGVAYSNMGDYQLALEYYNQALPIFRAVNDRVREASTLSRVGVAQQQVGDLQKALAYMKDALQLQQSLNDNAGQANTLDNIGVVHTRLGDQARAIEYEEQSLLLHEKVGDRRGQAAALDHIGQAYLADSNAKRSLEYFQRALTLWRDLGEPRGEALTLDNLGWAYSALGETDTASEYFSKALSLRKTIGDRRGEPSCLLGLAKLEAARGNLQKAGKLVADGLEIIESIRVKLASPEHRATYLAINRASYEFSVDVAMRLHKLDPLQGHAAAALRASERGRARSLLETLSEAAADIGIGSDPALIEREIRLRRLLNAKEGYRMTLVSRRGAKEDLSTIERELRDLLAEYEEVRGLIRIKSPRYAALTQPVIPDLATIQQTVLDDKSILLEYALGDERSYMWVVTSDSIASFELPARSTIEGLSRRVYGLLTARNQTVKFETAPERERRLAASDAEIAKAASELSKMLLGPVANGLAGKRILVVAEGALQYVPFGALPAPGDYKTPLIVRNEILNLPSASVMALMRKEFADRKPASRMIAVLADPVFDVADTRITHAGKPGEPKRAATGSLIAADLKRAVAEVEGVRETSGLPRLPFTREEAEGIMSLIPPGQGLKALDFDASRARVTSEELGQYRIIHFATHGLLNSETPGLTGIVLSLVDQTGQPVDGFLRLNGVYNLSLKADLVVLSGCKTGLGKDVKGEGLLGLTRGFMFAGTPRVVVSLWDVNDRATAELMKQFYKAMLGKGLRPAAALREAQIAMWRDRRWSAPYYWAAFVLQGEWK